MGLEPTTARLRAARSTDWARKATDIIHITSLFYQYYHQSTWIHAHMTIWIYRYIITDTWLYGYTLTNTYWHTDILTMTPLTHMLLACLSCFYTSYLLLFISVLLPLTSFYLHVLYHHILTAAFSSFFLSSSYTFFYPLLRKLPWLSRQSDRLLTDRSLVRSQAEAPFLLFHLLAFT